MPKSEEEYRFELRDKFDSLGDGVYGVHKWDFCMDRIVDILIKIVPEKYLDEILED